MMIMESWNDEVCDRLAMGFPTVRQCLKLSSQGITMHEYEGW